MVRLKDLFRGKRVYFLTYFNSTMVRLKARKTLKDFPKWTYFNSTMVRLKDLLVMLLSRYFPLFQFHYGTIKSLGELVNAGREA